MQEKVMVIIKNKENKYLLLKGSANDPQFKESFWYVITGAVEYIDKDIYDSVKREVKEETNLEINNIKYLNWIFYYDSLGNKCKEKVFIASNINEVIILNEESIDYKWCTLEEFMNLIKWYSSKEDLKYALLNNGFKEEKETYIK